MKITSIIIFCLALLDTFFSISGSATVTSILYAAGIGFFVLARKMKALDDKILKTLDEGEALEKSSMAEASIGLGKAHAGKLVLTNKRLFFKVGAMVGGGEEVESVENSEKEFSIPLSEITSIETGLKDLTVVVGDNKHIINVGLGKTKSWAEAINSKKN